VLVVSLFEVPVDAKRVSLEIGELVGALEFEILGAVQ